MIVNPPFKTTGSGTPDPSARYWGILITETVDGSGNCEMGQIEMRSVPAGANIATNSAKAAATSASISPDQPASNSFSGNSTLFWRSAGGVPQRIYYDFTSATTIRELFLTPQDGGGTGSPGPGRMPKSFKVQYCNGDPTVEANWSTIQIANFSTSYDHLWWWLGTPGVRFTFRAVPVWFRLNIAASNGSIFSHPTVSVLNWAGYNAFNGSDNIMLLTFGGSANSSGYGIYGIGPNTPNFAFYNGGASSFNVGWGVSSAPQFGDAFPPGWLSIGFFCPINGELTSYSITCGNFGAVINSMATAPNSWTLEQSYDFFATSPIILDTQSGITGWSPFVAKTFTIP